MRKQFVRTVEELMGKDERLVLLLGDISVFGFRNAFERHPDRTYNLGVCEQAMTGVGAGLARAGCLPILHTIAPFLVERCFEQIKVDLCYQKLPANIVSVGASYDYAALGCTHHCPGDVAVLRMLPGMEIVVPGTPGEFDRLFRTAYANPNPTYFRLSERSNPQTHEVAFGRANVLKKGKQATVIAVGPALPPVLAAVKDLDVTVLYYTTVAPFDGDTLRQNNPSGKIVLVEPFYAGTLVADIHTALGAASVAIETIGVPHRFLTDYGHAEEHDEAIGLTPAGIRKRIADFIGRS
jgi:transketolase